MPFETGNKLASGPRPKPFRDVLKMELAAAGDDHKALRLIARNLIEQAQTKEGLAAIKEIADRLDGKAPQPLKNDDDEAFQVILQPLVRQIVDPKGSDSSGI
jgi:hypothetical protein